MITIQTELPEKLYEQARAMAKRENISVERLASLALAQALGVWQTQSIIAERAAKADRNAFLKFMDQVPDNEPVEGDRIK
jgi:hypothetical protein